MMLDRSPQHCRIRGEALQHHEPVRQAKDRDVCARLLMLDVVEQLLPDEHLILHRRIECVDEQNVQRAVRRDRSVVGEDAGRHWGYRRPGLFIRCRTVLFEVADCLRLLLLGEHEVLAVSARGWHDQLLSSTTTSTITNCVPVCSVSAVTGAGFAVCAGCELCAVHRVDGGDEQKSRHRE